MEKKIISIILALVMMAVSIPYAFADDERLGEDEIISEDIVVEEEEAPIETPVEEDKITTTTKSSSQSYGDGRVATVYLCSIYYNIPHIFIYIVNNSGSTLKVGLYNLSPGEGVSMGTLGFSTIDGDGPGLYYNVETYRYGSDNMFSKFICLETGVNRTQLNNISNFIRSANIWDPLIINCIYFAVSIWNMAGGTFIFPIQLLPYITRISMQLRGAKYKNINFTIPSRNNVYKQVGNGSSAKLKVVVDNSLS